jgi:excisionase family DNA binding protein
MGLERKRTCHEIPRKKEMDKLLSPKKLAELLDVKPGTIYSWVSRGVPIPHVKIEGTLRFREKAIEKWLIERERARKKRIFA